MEKLRNRLFACGSAAVMLMTALPLQTALTAFAAEADAAKIGDVNGDGKKDSADLDALKALLATRPDTVIVETDDLQPYDVTQDGFVDARDTYALSQYVTGAAKAFPVSQGDRIEEKITLALESGTCFPGDEVQLKLSFVDWTKDIAAYDITLGFDPALELKKVDFLADDCQYIGATRSVKLTGLHKNDPLHRGDFAVLTFQTPKDYDSDFSVAVEGANIFRSDYNHYSPVRPSAVISVYPLCEPVALETSGIGSKSVSLKWDMPFTDQPVTGYRVYRDDRMVAETTELFYTDKGLTADTAYTYSVSAVTNSGTETAESVPVTVRTAGPKIRSAAFPAETVSDTNSDLTVRLEQAALLSEMKLDIKTPEGKTLTESVSLDGEAMSTVSWHWDVSKLADGAYTVGMTVTDTDGASDTEAISVQVVNSPLKPVTLKGTAGDRTALLFWTMADEAAVTGYVVYRLNDDGKTWDQLAEIKGRSTLTYTDKQLKDGKQYTYTVASRDSSGLESPKSSSVRVVPDADDTPPEITLFKSASGQRVSGALTVSVRASDDNGIAAVYCEISADEGKTWTKLGETEGDFGKWTVNTADYKDGVYRLRAMAADNDKNLSNDLSVMEIAFDNTAPEQVRNVHAVSVTEKSAAIAWDNVSDQDFSHFIAIVSDSTKSWEQKIDKTLGMNLSDLTPDTGYTVTVYAVDAAGNAGVPSEPFSFISTSDTTPPTVSSLGVSSEYVSANSALTVRVTAKDQSQVTYCYLQYSQDQKAWKELKGAGAEPNLYLRDNTLQEGELYLRAYAEDKYGNKGDPEQAQIRTVTVDNSVPEAPEKLTAETAVSSNLLTWTKSASEDVVYYRVDRASGGEYSGNKTIAEKCRVLSFEDTDVAPDGTYYYRVYAVDRAGNLSQAVSSGKVKRVPDTEEPTIRECVLSVQQAQQTICSAHRTLQIVAIDNTKLKAVSAAYRCAEDAEWTALETEEQNANRSRSELVVRTELPESVLRENSVTVQVTAEDISGNKRVQTYTFKVDDSRAEIRNAAAKPEDKHIRISWECPDASGVSRFMLLRKIGAGGSESLITQFKPQQGQTAFEYADADLLNGGKMIYRIQADMKNGNTVSVTLDAVDVQAIPKAVLEYSPEQVVNAEYQYDARGSQNAADIVSVAISFGDSTEQIIKKSVEDALFTHKYESTGEYQVTLTVTNASGMSDSRTVKVTVAEKSVMANVNVHVRKMDGSAASYATVYSDVGTDRQVRYQADADGNVTIECTAGTHEFGVFADGCLPATKYCAFAPDASANLDFSLVQDELVSADFEVSRMSLEEIKAAGIDVKNPENCQMVMIDVSLSYSITSTVTDHVKVYYDSNSGQSWVSGGSGGGGGGGSSDYHYELKTVSRDINTVVLLRVPAKAQFLKEFFKVDMIVMNNASAAFSMTDCTASLNLPAGLSVVEDVPASRPRVTELGTIGGGKQQTVSWIVRGDKSGTYNFSADFSGTLQPFNEYVSMNFASEQPITVEGQEAATITVNFDPVIRKKNMFVEMLIENNTANDLYELSTEIGKVISNHAGTTGSGEPKAEVYQTRFTGTDGILEVIGRKESVEVLHPGEKFSVVYRIKNVLSEEIQGTYKKIKREISANTSSRNAVVQIKSVNITDINDPAYGIAFDPETQFILVITNKNGTPVANADVELGRYEGNGKKVLNAGKTDEKGRLVVSRYDDERLCLEVHAEGYRQYYNSRYAIPKKASDYYDMITMSANLSGKDYSLRYVTFSGGGEHCNLLSQQQEVNVFEGGTFSIIGASNDAGVRYELMQRGESRPVKSTEGDSGTFAFMELTADLFKPDKAVLIRVTLDTGDTLDTPIGLQIIRFDPNDPLSNPAVAELGSQIVEFSNDTDLVATSPGEVDSNKSDLSPVHLDISLTFTPNKQDIVKQNGKYLFPAETDDKVEDAPRGTIKVTPGKDNIKMEFSLMKYKFIKVGGSGNVMFYFYFGFEASVKYYTITDKADLSIGATASAGIWGRSSPDCIKPGGIKLHEKQTAHSPLRFEIMPGVFFAVDVTFSISGKIGYAATVSNLLFGVPEKESGSFSLEIQPDVQVVPMLGFGLHRFAEVYVYGAFDLAALFKGEGRFRDLRKSIHLDCTTVDGTIGIAGELFDWRIADITIFSFDTLYLYKYDSDSPRPRFIPMNALMTEDGRTAEEAIRDPELYKTVTADMIPQAGQFSGQFGDGLTEMQTGISSGSAPVIVSDGTNTLMTWIVKDAARGTDNASYAVWSRYDSSSRTWSAPKAVDDNGNADTQPVLFAGTDGIRIAYMESAAVYEEGNSPSLSDYGRQMVLKTAKFDPEAGAFTDFRTAEVNADGGFAAEHTFMQASDGTVYLVWNSNANGRIFGDDDSNRILCAKETADGWDTPAVLAENLPSVGGMTCGQNAAGEPVIAYTVSEPAEDGANAAALYVTGLSGETKKLASGTVSAPQFAKIPGKDASGLVWYQDGGIFASVDLEQAETVISGEDYSVSECYAIAGDRILFLANTDNASALFSTRYDAAAGGFTNPVCIESGENTYYNKLSLADVNGETLYAMTRTVKDSRAETGLSSTALVGGVLGETADLRIGETAFAYSDVKPGQTLPLTVDVWNNGTETVNAVTLNMQDGSGNVIASETKEIQIPSGLGAEIEFAPALPETLAPAEYTVSVSAAETDKTPDNNTAVLDLTKTDLAVETSISYAGDSTFVTILASNRSEVPASAVITVRPQSAEEETVTLFSDPIAPHTSAYWRLNAEDLLGDIYADIIEVIAEADTADGDETNNRDSAFIAKSGMDPYKTGDINLDGKVELEDVMLALKCYTMQVANRKDIGLNDWQQNAADVNRDGAVDVLDAMSILKFYVFTIAGKAPASFTEFLEHEQNGGANHESE